jgi:hypothetical protein
MVSVVALVLFLFKDCEAIGLNHLVRHGARYPNTPPIKMLNRILPKVRDLILNSSVSNKWLCESDRQALQSWTPDIKPEMGNQLTRLGIEETQRYIRSSFLNLFLKGMNLFFSLIWFESRFSFNFHFCPPILFLQILIALDELIQNIPYI